jgi:hypothetical protein
MILGLFVFIFWINIIIFQLIPRKLTVVENSFLLFMVTILVINIFTITELNMHLVITNKKPSMYLCEWTFRTLIIPVSMMNFSNLVHQTQNQLLKWGIGALFFFEIGSVEFLTLQLKIKAYTGWNGYFTGLSFIFILLFTYFLMKWFKFGIEKWEKNDHRL